MNAPAKWIIYARKSTESEDRQIQSIEDQIKFAKDTASRFGLNIVEVISEAKSAKGANKREGFDRLISLISSGKATGILVWKLDRLARNFLEGGNIIDLLQKGVIQEIRTNEGSHYPSDNVLMLALHFGLANQFSRDLSVNVKRGLKSRAEKGWFPGIPPIGYVNISGSSKGDKEITVDEERFLLVRKMWELMLRGEYTAIEVLRIATNEWLLDTPKRRRNGKKPMASSYIYKVFTNVFYTGHFYYGGILYQGKHKPMITMAEFDRVQMLLSKRSQPRPIVHDFSYTGIMKCANCGASITASEKKKMVKAISEYKHYTYYHCTRRMGVCREPPITLNDLEEQIESKLRENQIGDMFYRLALETLKSGKGQEVHTRQAIYDRQKWAVEELQKKLDKLRTFLLKETISEAEYLQEKKEIEYLLGIQTVKLKEAGLEADGIDKRIEDALKFSHSAIFSLKNSGSQAQRSILMQLGSNQQLKQKELCIDVHGWFSALKKGEIKLQAALGRFELKKGNSYKPEDFFSQFSPLMLSVIDNVRTELSKNDKC
jgi:DNA invertase Pin-like site-specific DNA recombinase